MSKICLIPPDILHNSSDPDPPPHHLIIKAVKLVSVLEAEIDHPLCLLKVEGREFKRNFNSCSSKTTKFA